MANFGYDDVLLKWEITGTRWGVGSYSHFNSMMKRSKQAEQSDNDWRLWGSGQTISRVKISGNAVCCGWGEVWVLRHETRTCEVLKLVR
jgi:hypothetical protein